MLVAAIDTTTRGGSCALVRGPALVAVRAGDPDRPHAVRLPGELLAVLADAQLAPGDVDAFAVAAGPGSFTGLRIGIAAVQGLAFATGRPAIGVSALAAIAHAVAPRLPAGMTRVAAWIDAQRDEVFACVFRCVPGANGTVRVAEERAPVVAAPAGVLAQWGPAETSSLVFAGNGALAYRELLLGAGVPAERIVEPTPALAPSVAALAIERLATGQAFPPHGIVPLYVRRPDAELARDRRAPRP